MIEALPALMFAVGVVAALLLVAELLELHQARVRIAEAEAWRDGFEAARSVSTKTARRWGADRPAARLQATD